MTTFDPDLLVPPEEEEELPLYRPVWRSVSYETITLMVGTLGINLAVSLFDVTLESVAMPLVTALLALAPLGAWFWFSWRGEQRVQQPRQRLLAMMATSALVANGVAAPFIELFIAPDQWLNMMSGLARILGYAVTVGVTIEFLKYLVLRYMAWPDRFERRIDCVAYSRAISLAFATVLNLRFALLEGGAQPGAAAIHILSLVLMHEAIGLAMSHRLMNLKFGKAGMLTLSGGLLLGGLLHGIYAAFRAGFVVGGFGIGAVANVPIMGLMFSIGFAATLFAIYAFLIANADARDVRMSNVG